MWILLTVQHSSARVLFRQKAYSNGKIHVPIPNAGESSGRAIYGVGLQPLSCCHCVFESRCGNECLYLLSVVCCQVEVSMSG